MSWNWNRWTTCTCKFGYWQTLYFSQYPLCIFQWYYALGLIVMCLTLFIEQFNECIFILWPAHLQEGAFNSYLFTSFMLTTDCNYTNVIVTIKTKMNDAMWLRLNNTKNNQSKQSNLSIYLFPTTYLGNVNKCRLRSTLMYALHETFLLSLDPVLLRLC